MIIFNEKKTSFDVILKGVTVYRCFITKDGISVIKHQIRGGTLSIFLGEKIQNSQEP